jgi:thiol-disulfide isomerase/thioredoxin
MVSRSPGSRLAPALLLALVAALVLGVAVHRAMRERPAQLGAPLPALTLTNLAGNSVAIRGSSGTTIYNVFATWCPPCREETPVFASEARALRARGIRIVGIDQGESPDAVEAFIDRFGVPYPVLIDDTHVTSALLGAHVIPETLLVRNGVLASVHVGPMSAQELRQLTAER